MADACPRARALLDTATSLEASQAIVYSFYYLAHSRSRLDPQRNEKLQWAQVRYRHALRRLKEAYPGEFCGLPQDAPRLLVDWAVSVEAMGEPLPLARRAARLVGYDYDRAVADCRARQEREHGVLV